MAEFSSERQFDDFLDQFDLSYCGSFVKRATETADGDITKKDRGYMWCNRDLVVETECNPKTGEGGEHCDIGNASSFSATGDSRTLEHMYMQFHMQKGSAPRFKDLYYYEDGDVEAKDGGQF